MMDEFTKAFGARLKQARINANYTCEELAAMVFVSTNTIYRWERGHYTPSLPMVCVIAKVLGVPVGWLAAGEVQDVW